jgi:hypothetical protein
MKAGDADRETPYWIVNFLAGFAMVGCLIVFASSFPGGESQSPADDAVAEETPAVRSCVEQVQLLAMTTLEEIAVRSHESGCAGLILEQARFLQVCMEERLNSLPPAARKQALLRLRSRVMEQRFGSVITQILTRSEAIPPNERKPLEMALEVLRRVARRFDGSRPSVAQARPASDEDGSLKVPAVR